LSKHIPSFKDCPEYLIASFIGLICRLGLKGLIEEGFKEIFPTYHSMTGTGDINSPENNNSGGIKENTSGDSSSTTNNSTGVQKKDLNLLVVLFKDSSKIFISNNLEACRVLYVLQY
jgi:hypothetical protein